MGETFRVLTLNNISARGLERLPRERYEVASGLDRPDAVLLRSADMHKFALPESVIAVARAGAGTNNIPVAALTGDNVVRRSPLMPWFAGPTLLHHLETLDVSTERRDAPFRMPVQLVLRHGDFRGYAGTVASGRLRPGGCGTASGSRRGPDGSSRAALHRARCARLPGPGRRGGARRGWRSPP